MIAQVLHRNFCNLFAYNMSKLRNLHIFSFFENTHQVVKNLATIFAYLKWHGQGLLKKLYLIFFNPMLFPKTFVLNELLHLNGFI